MQTIPSADERAPGSELLAAVVRILEQGEGLLQLLSDELYTRPLPVAFGAAIGGHYRHSLDHFRSLLAVAPGGDLDYDRRERGTAVETNRAAAWRETRELRAGYEAWLVVWQDRSLAVTCKTSAATADSQTVPSTVSREVMYVVAHAVHHFALIRVMAGLMGLNLPPDFGVAASTLQYQAAEAPATAGGG